MNDKGDTRVLHVTMGEGVVAKAPHIISSLGLGSCVAVALLDIKRQIGGLAHIMISNSPQMPEIQNTENTPFVINKSINTNQQYKSADPAITTLLKLLQAEGTERKNMIAKMAGGAQMFAEYKNSYRGIGEDNIIAIRDILKREEIPLTGEDVGGHRGRNVKLYLNSGKLIVTTFGKEDQII